MVKIQLGRFLCCQPPEEQESVPQETVLPSGFSVTSVRPPSVDGGTRRSSAESNSRLPIVSASRASSGVPIFNRTFISPFQQADQSIRHTENLSRAESGELPSPEEIKDFYALYGRLSRIEQRFNKRTGRRPSWNPPNSAQPSTSVFATKPPQSNEEDHR